MAKARGYLWHHTSSSSTTTTSTITTTLCTTTICAAATATSTTDEAIVGPSELTANEITLDKIQAAVILSKAVRKWMYNGLQRKLQAVEHLGLIALSGVVCGVTPTRSHQQAKMHKSDRYRHSQNTQDDAMYRDASAHFLKTNIFMHICCCKRLLLLLLSCLLLWSKECHSQTTTEAPLRQRHQSWACGKTFGTELQVFL